MDINQDEDYISDLTERVFLIKRELESGKVKIADHLVEGFIASFEKIRLRADGKVDPLTVDARIRAMGAAVNHFIERENTKKNHSITDLQAAYFDILFGNFGDVYNVMIKSDADPFRASGFFSQKSEYVDHINGLFPEFLEQIKDFWKTLSDIGIYHLQDGHQLKANFSGDLFPSYFENAVSIAGLYVDTITLPCPVLRVGGLYGLVDKAEFTRLLLKHILTCMTYKNIALEDVEPAIVLILPNRSDYTEENHEQLFQECDPYILAHAHYLYGRKFESRDEFLEFSESLPDIESVLKNLKNPERLVFDSDWGGNAKEQLTRLLADPDRITQSVFGSHAGMEVFSSCVGRIPQAYAAKRHAQNLGSTPYINADTSWLYYTWLIEYESLKFEIDHENRKNLHMVHAISSGLQDGFSWLGNVPVDKIIELRRNNLMDEVRSVLSSGVSNLIHATEGNYTQTTQQVIDNVDKAFIQHQRVLEKARKEKLKLYGLEVAPCIANGVIAIAGAMSGNIALASLSAGLGVLGMPTLKDIRSKFKERQENIEAYNRTATGILFSHKN